MAPLVLTSDRDAARRLFTGDPLTRHHGNDAVRPLIGERAVMLLEPRGHLARRRLLLPPFHGDRVRVYAETMQRLVDGQVGRWRAGDTVTVLPTAQDITIEVILSAVLGVADDDLRRRLRRLIDDLLFYPVGAAHRRAAARRPSRLVPPARVRAAVAFAAGLPTPAVATYFPALKTRATWNVVTRRWWRLRDELFALFREHIAATRADPGLAEREDVLAMLVQARDEDGRALTDEDLQDDLLTLIGAGHETTAAAIAWGCALLVHDGAVLERATAAARAGDTDYLAALVKEVLRVRPPIPVAAGRVLDEPFGIGEHTVPAGTLVLVDAWGVHHDPELYPEPSRLRPERFLDRAPEPYSWLPFGGGAHRCLGSALAELEIRIALETILRRVDLAAAEPTLPPMARRAITLVPHGGTRVRVAQLA